MIAEPNRTPWDLKFNLLRVPVRVHPYFWLAALLLSYPTDRSPFTAERPFMLVLVSIACIFVSIMVHEFGHALCGRHYGDSDNHVVLYHFGGLCVQGRGVPKRWPQIFMLLWGPGAGFILAALAYGFQLLFEHAYLPAPNLYVWHTIVVLVMINVTWGIMNLLPVFPLDGGQIMREVVLWKAPQRGDPFALTISFYAAIAVVVGWIGKMIYDSSHGVQTQFLPVLLFGMLAYSSYRTRQQLGEYGSLGGADEPREPWERDADWWKQGR